MLILLFMVASLLAQMTADGRPVAVAAQQQARDDAELKFRAANVSAARSLHRNKRAPSTPAPTGFFLIRRAIPIFRHVVHV